MLSITRGNSQTVFFYHTVYCNSLSIVNKYYLIEYYITFNIYILEYSKV